MARETFDEVLQRRDGYTQAEVDETKQEILERIADGEDGFDIIDEYGLEPDYLEDLICWQEKRIVRRLALRKFIRTSGASSFVSEQPRKGDKKDVA